MDKLGKYRAIVTALIEKHSKYQSSVGDVITYPICDEKTDNYLLLDVGWMPYGRHEQIPIHIRLINGKVSIEADNTDAEIAQQLIEKGVDENDIVLGFEQPEKLAA